MFENISSIKSNGCQVLKSKTISNESKIDR